MTAKAIRLMTIDADAHVIETERTWDYVDPSDAQYRPVVVGPVAEGSKARFWMADGKIRDRARIDERTEDVQTLAERTGRNFVAPREAKMMENISARLQHMDETDVDIQVLHPTLFIRQVADRPEADVVVCRSYNRWLAGIWAQSNNRLRWVAMPPLLDMKAAVKELEFAVENGACAVGMRPIEGDRTLPDPYFHPLYDAANELGVAVAVHIGNSNPYVERLLGGGLGGSAFPALRLMCAAAAHALILSEIPSKFPNIRWGFLESASMWVPAVVHDLRRRIRAGKGKEAPADLFKDNHVYVACQTDDDIPYVLNYTGEDNLVIGTDYGHNDTASEIEALRNLRDQEGIAPQVIDKILSHNPKALYGL
jgi:predicted TIM-barrel fold metal-dependent hydrolase